MGQVLGQPVEWFAPISSGVRRCPAHLPGTPIPPIRWLPCCPPLSFRCGPSLTACDAPPRYTDWTFEEKSMSELDIQLATGLLLLSG